MGRPVIIENPTFQLNLMLLMSMPAPPEGPLRSIFADAGYRALFVERLISIPAPTHLALQDAGLAVSRGARPDLFLVHDNGQQFVLIECKRSSFSSTSSTTRQARALLVLSGSDLSRFVGVGLGTWTSIVSYVCVEGNGSLLWQTMTDLSNELQIARLPTAATATLELLSRLDGVYMVAVQQSATLVNLTLDIPVRVLQLRPGEDPRPLYLIPFMPGGDHEPDELGKRVLRERLRATLAELLGKANQVGQQYRLDKDVLTRAIPAWDLWDNTDAKRNLQDHTRRIFRRVFSVLARRAGMECRIDNLIVHIPPIQPSQLAVIRSYLISSEYRQLEIDVFGPSQGELPLG